MTGRRTEREIVAIASARRDGSAYHTRRVRVPWPRRGGPFLFIDEIGPLDLIPGQPWQSLALQRRSVKSLIYLLEGEWECTDHAGERIVLGPGDLYWKTTRAEHTLQDRPSPALLQRGGRLHCLAVTLRVSSQRAREAGEGVARSNAVVETVGPASVRMLVGSLLGRRGAFDDDGSLAIGDWRIDAGASVSVPVAEPHVVALYVHQDVVWLGAHGLALREGQVAVLGPGREVLLKGPERSLRPARVLLLAGARSKRSGVAGDDFL